MRRLYFRAGDFHSAGRRGCRAAQQKRGRWRGNFKQGREEFESYRFECIEKRESASVSTAGVR